MTKPIEVEIVRPIQPWVALVVIAGYFISALVLMWLAPDALHWHPGYHQSVALIVLFRVIFSDSGYLFWTKPNLTRKASR